MPSGNRRIKVRMYMAVDESMGPLRCQYGDVIAFWRSVARESAGVVDILPRDLVAVLSAVYSCSASTEALFSCFAIASFMARTNLNCLYDGPALSAQLAKPPDRTWTPRHRQRIQK